MAPTPPRSTLFPYTTLFRSFRKALAEALLLTKVDLARFHRFASRVLGPGASLKDRIKLKVALDRLVLAGLGMELAQDRKSTRLNSSHANISYAVFCLKNKSD